MTSYVRAYPARATGCGPDRILLLDTCLLVDHLRGYDPARRWLTSIVEQGDARLTYSVITLAELVSGLGAESSGGDAIGALLSLMEPIPVDEAIALSAGDYMRRWRRSHGLAMPDALIAGTAKSRGAALVTRDTAHFPMDDIALIAPD